MRGQTIVCVLVSLCLLAVAPVWADNDPNSSTYLSALHENNLLPNPDFEEPSQANPNWPAGWEANFNLVDFNQPAWDGAIAYAGRHSIRMSAPMGAEAAWTSPMIDVKPNTKYRFTGYVRTQGVAPQKARFSGTYVISVHSDRGPLFPRPFAAGPCLEGDNEWTEVNLEFKTPARATHLQVSAAIAWGGKAAGHVWFDAVKLEEVVAE